MNINELTAIARELANASVPPAGYVECPKKCGRWHEKYLRGSVTIEYTMCAPCWAETEETTGTAATWAPSPPIAAPAKPVERRKGQRWKCAWDSKAVEATIMGERHTKMGTWPMSNGDWWCDSRWTAKGAFGSRCTMTLIADAPADPSGAGEAVKLECESCGTPEGWIHVAGCKRPPRDTCCPRALNGAADHNGWCKNAKPPAQEAPKAVPVCVGAFHTCSGPVLARAAGAVRGVMCEAWMLRLEGIIDRATPSTGTPYKGPERINRALARDEMIDGDCWPEAGR